MLRINGLSRALWIGVAGLLIASSAPAAPVQWSLAESGNGHWYEAVLAPSSFAWADARVAAENAGGYLATITSAAENDFVFQLIDDPAYWVVGHAGNNSEGPWIGGFQPAGTSEPSGGWQWVTGEPFSFTAWGPGQPNNAGGDQDILHFWSDDTTRRPTWNDGDTVWYIPVAYVVEYVPEPSSVSLLSLGLLAMLRRRRSA